MRSEFVGILTTLGVILVVTLALVLMFPNEGFSIAIDSGRVHLGVGMLAIGVLLICCRAMRRGVLLALVGLVVLAPALRSTLNSSSNAPDMARQSLNILNFNILGINGSNGQRIAEYIIESGADIVSIQEAVPLSKYLQELDINYPYRVGCGEQISGCDSMLLSKLPLTEVTVHSLGPVFGDRTIIAAAETAAGQVWIVATHMTKPYFDFVGVRELDRLVRLVGKLEGPLIVAGDFNSGVHAGANARILYNAGLVAAPFEPATWPVWAGPLGIPIDHVLARLPATVLSTTAIEDAMGSNHRGLQSQVAVSNP